MIALAKLSASRHTIESNGIEAQGPNLDAQDAECVGRNNVRSPCRNRLTWDGVKLSAAAGIVDLGQ